MGIIILDRGRIKRNWDMWKLKLALDNFATRQARPSARGGRQRGA